MESKLLTTIGLPSQLDGIFKGDFFQGQREERVAFIGRSNVGKSSLINALLEKRLAYTSATPGKTQVLNFFLAPKDGIIWVDLPGYGHAKIAREKRTGWEVLIAKYLETDPKLRYLVVLMDARHGPTDGDLEAIQYLSRLKGDMVFVFTKWDAVRTQSDRARTQKESILRLQSIGIDVKSANEVFWISAKEKHGIPQFKKAVLSCPNKSS